MQNRKFPKWGIALVVIVVIVVLIGGLFIAPYNNMISLEENVTTKEANIQSSLQSRLDKINELMPSVQGSMDHESEVYQEITALRSGIQGVSIDEEGNMTIDSNASASELEQADQASSQLLDDIRIAIEAYPDLGSTQLMSDFMTSVEGIENRLSVAREEYNEAVQEYNTTIRKFPNNLIAGMMGFESIDPYEASDEAQEAPQVSFE
ncbi:MAG TPA: LemA family protein [Candidatus Faecalicoccus intestinipullorum]|uniref:LemA family protein n=1 Tax=Faecalicoccus acidiformans TaxID=915173 RepID=UPI001F84874F|nr:LemA family protein [Faecalicoccus acidiformans]HIW18479.1 LemA family protein [Candidatus Faecalicoccus intestinipullorum]